MTIAANSANRNTYATQTYRHQQVTSANPLQLILMAYDVAIAACGQRDLERAAEALNVLRNALDLEQGQVAMDLFSLYLYVADLARMGEWGEAAGILRELMNAWIEAMAHEQEEVVQAVV